MKPARLSHLLAAGLVVACAAIARAGDLIPGERIVAARDGVLGRPEFARLAEDQESSVFGKALKGFMNWMWRMQTSHPVLFWTAFGVLALTVVVLVAHIVWTIRVAGRTDFAAAELALEEAVRRADPAPFRRRALELAAEGDLEGAVRALYTALLLTLDRRGAVRFARHKALLDYRMECADEPTAIGTLDTFAGTYHPGSFGRRPPTREQFDRLLEALDALGEGRP